MAADGLGRAVAADVAVEADHPVGRRHHHMQVVGDHQHPAAPPPADVADKPVERRLSGEVDALDRFVEDQQLRVADQGAGQQRPLELAAGKRLYRRVDQVGDAGLGQRREHRVAGPPDGQRHQPGDGQRQHRIHRQPLRQIADPQALPPADGSAVRPQQPEQHPDQRRLAGAVGTDQGDDLVGGHFNVDTGEHGVAAERHVDPLAGEQGAVTFVCGRRHRRLVGPSPVSRRQLTHTPATSTTGAETSKPAASAPSTMAWKTAALLISATVLQRLQMRNWAP